MNVNVNHVMLKYQNLILNILNVQENNMPWSKNDYPNSMKNLDPKIREKAIHIAEAMRKSGSPEGVAIATGIKKAKGLVKLAANFKQLLRPIQRNKGFFGATTIGGSAIGGLTGAAIGADSSYEKNVYGERKLDKHFKPIIKKNVNVGKRTLIGAGIGAVSGGLLAGAKAYDTVKKVDKRKLHYRKLTRESKNDFRKWDENFQKKNKQWHEDFQKKKENWDDFFRKSSSPPPPPPPGRSKSSWDSGWDQYYERNKQQYQYTPPPPPPPRRPSADHAAFFKEHGNIDHTTISTKKQAEKIYKDAARKHHPDMPGGNTEKMKKINNDWDSIRNSPWFDKLAMIMRRLKWG
jgi:outer membrane lipoprotein SlyB